SVRKYFSTITALNSARSRSAAGVNVLVHDPSRTAATVVSKPHAFDSARSSVYFFTSASASARRVALRGVLKSIPDAGVSRANPQVGSFIRKETMKRGSARVHARAFARG